MLLVLLAVVYVAVASVCVKNAHLHKQQIVQDSVPPISTLRSVHNSMQTRLRKKAPITVKSLKANFNPNIEIGVRGSTVIGQHVFKMGVFNADAGKGFS